MSELPAADLIADYPLAAHNTFGFAVRARFAVRVESPAGLVAALADPRATGLARLTLGGGSNVVLSRDVDALVLLMAIRGRALVGETPAAWLVRAGAGENWHDFVSWTLDQGWPGLENLALIPGSVGAAPIQNIGAYGLEMAERFESLSALELATGRMVELDATACRFGYRDSFFKRGGAQRFIITAVTFRLPKAWQARTGYAELARTLEAGAIGALGAPSARNIFNAVVAIRRAKLPDPATIGNAGSFFKNPSIGAAQYEMLLAREPGLVGHLQADGGYKCAAGWMIDQCGWRGRALGMAAVHERQALVLVNRGGATGTDVLALAARIQADVAARFGVALEIEPDLIPC
jgi:UDP-N-acetylmuramate dehydrogenase